MVAQPCFVVLKPGPSKFHLVNDHMAGHSSLNAAIPLEDGSFHPDNLWDLGSLLLTFYHVDGHTPAWIFKSDASLAYHLLPCHPWWQVHQVTMIDGNFHINHCCVFGNCTSGAIWSAFYAQCCGLEYMLKVFQVSFTMWTMHFHLNLMRHLCFTHHMTVGTQRNKSGYSICLMRLGFLMRRENRSLGANSPLSGCGSA